MLIFGVGDGGICHVHAPRWPAGHSKGEDRELPGDADGVVRLFPAWPVDQDARFGTLRAVGAFLVSVEIKNGVIGGVSILNEKGHDCAIVNPWPGKQVRLDRNGKPSETFEGERFTFKTGPGETAGLVPVEGSR